MRYLRTRLPTRMAPQQSSCRIERLPRSLRTLRDGSALARTALPLLLQRKSVDLCHQVLFRSSITWTSTQ